MTAITTRAGKGSTLTWNEVDANFTNLNTDKAETDSPTFTGTVSGITKAMVGLGNVDNTSDINKPVSTATQTAINTATATAISDHTALADPHTQYLRESVAAASGGSALIGYTSGVTGAVARTVEAKQKETISVKDFGAVGDGITDDTAAFTAAIEYAMLSNADSFTAASIMIPSGKYLITKNNFLGDINFSTVGAGIVARAYFSMIGEGWSSEILWRPTSAIVGDYYCYYNDGTTNNLIEPLLSNLRITMDSSSIPTGSTVNGFYVVGTAPYPTQGLKFDRVRMVGAPYLSSDAVIAKAGTFLTIRGTVNADVTNMIGCRVVGMKTLLDIGANAESVCHSIIGTDAEVMYGDVIKTSGGSGITVVGGSFTMMSQGPGGQLSYLLSIIGTTISIVGTFTFIGIRCEFNQNQAGGTFSNLFLLDGTGLADSYNSMYPKVNFVSCNFSPMLGAARNSIVLDAATKGVVNFDGCDLSALHKVHVYSSKASLNTLSNGPFTTLTFSNGSGVSSDSVTFASANSTGRVSSRNCPGVFDYDLAPNGSSYAVLGNNRPLKTVTIWGTCWPDVAHAQPMSVKLPVGAILKSIMVRKSAGGASAASYGIKAVDGSLGVTYGSSVVAAQNVQHDIAVDNINLVATTDNQRYVFIIADPGNPGANTNTSMNAADYAIVNYY